MMVGQAAAAEQQRGRVALRIAADQQHPLALLRHHVGEVGEREALADAALAVDRDDLRLLRRPAGRHRDRARSPPRRAALSCMAERPSSGLPVALMRRLSSRGPSSGRRGRRTPCGRRRRRVGRVGAVRDQAVERQAAGSTSRVDGGEVGSRHSAATRMRASRMKAGGKAKDSGSL